MYILYQVMPLLHVKTWILLFRRGLYVILVVCFCCLTYHTQELGQSTSNFESEKRVCYPLGRMLVTSNLRRVRRHRKGVGDIQLVCEACTSQERL